MGSQFAKITDSARRTLEKLPSDVILVAAVKGHTLVKVEAAVLTGFIHTGHNYVQEAQPMIKSFGNLAIWNTIGSVQRNKTKKGA